VYTPKLLTEIKAYSREKALADLFAGVTVGVVALPLAMAFAIASGLPPERGLFTAIVAGFLISLFGGSKVQIGGPTGAFVVLISSITLQYGYSGLALCTLMAGIILILLGLFRMGGLIKFIPFPVTTGFTTGIAVVIFSTQIRDLLGLKIEKVPAAFLEKWQVYFESLNTMSFGTVLVGIGTIVVILLIQRFRPKLPAMLIGMVVATLVAHVCALNVETIGSTFGELPRMLPAPSFPKIEFSQIGDLAKPAFTVALLAAIESLLSATVADGMIGDRHRPNAELIAQGIANVGSVIFGGIPATGAIARTATNVKSGAKTPVAGVIHAVVLSLLLLLFAPVAKLIPLAALAGILVVVSYNMSELHNFVSICKGPKSDACVLILTFALTVLVDLTVAVQVGVVLAALLFIWRMSENTDVNVITERVQGKTVAEEEFYAIAPRDVPEGVEIFEINGPFFFGMIHRFKNAIRNMEEPAAALIIRARNVLAVDATGIHTLRSLYKQCRKKGIYLIFSEVHSQPLKAFQRSGLIFEVGRDNFCKSMDDALKRAKNLLKMTTKPQEE